MLGFPEEERGTYGKYRLLAELGKGGSANVYLAVARGPSGFNKLVVLKFLRTELAAEPDFRAMFLNEARLAARLNHPNVVQTYEVFEEGGRPIIVMEYLEGAPLSRILTRARDQDRPFPLAMHLRVISEVLSGLHYSHELRDYDGTPLGVVHRDMTPQNVFVSYSGKITLLDFGIAKLTSSIVDTQTGVMKGKLRYMPPEQIMGGTVDGRTDIFAVGVMLWEALTGQKMWRGISDAAVMNNIVKGAIPRPRSVRPDAPENLERICMKALASDRHDRYATAAELRDDLERSFSGQNLENRTIGQFVSAAFRDERLKTNELVELQLANIETATLSRMPLEDGLAGIPKLGPASTRPSTGTPRLESPKRKGSRFLLGMFLALAFVGLLSGRKLWQAAPPSAPLATRPVVTEKPPEPAPPPVPSAQPAAEPSTIALKINAWPLKTKLYLDEQPLPSNPYAGVVPRDAQEHTVRAEAPGFVGDKQMVGYDQDRELVFRLVPMRPGFRPHSGKANPAESDPWGVTGAPAPATAPAPAPPKDDCDPPYRIDENGIRHLKPACL